MRGIKWGVIKLVFNRMKTFMLLATLTALMLFVGQLLGGQGGLIIAIVLVLVFNLGSYFFSDKIVLKMYRAKEIEEKDHKELFRAVSEVAHLAGIPMPKVYIIPGRQANAFATGRSPKKSAVAFTVGILEILSKDELKGVIAHEVSHIKNRDILIQTIASMIAGVIGYVASMAKWGAIFGGFGGDRDEGSNIVEILALAIITPFIAMLIQLAISRSREYLADETGAKIIHNPHALASALEKIEKSTKHSPLNFGNPSTSSLFIANPFKASTLVNFLSTHPPMKERVKRLKEMN